MNKTVKQNEVVIKRRTSIFTIVYRFLFHYINVNKTFKCPYLTINTFMPTQNTYIELRYMYVKCELPKQQQYKRGKFGLLCLLLFRRKFGYGKQSTGVDFLTHIKLMMESGQLLLHITTIIL